MNCYEVYVYLDPRDPGDYVYGDINFKFRPVYVGKGSIKWKRKYVHLKNSNNKQLRNLMHTLSRLNQSPIIETLQQNITEQQALILEQQIISIIGRKDLNLGPLYNFTNGGDGHSGIKYTAEQLKNRSKLSKKYFKSLTVEQLKEHGQKSLKNRTEEGKKRGEILRKKTWSNKSIIEKKQIESKRYDSWKKTMNSRTIKQKKELSDKCKFASTKLRKQYFITIQYLKTLEIQTKFLNDWIKDGFARDGLMYRIKDNSTQPLYSRATKQWVKIIEWTKISPALIS